MFVRSVVVILLISVFSAHGNAQLVDSAPHTEQQQHYLRAWQVLPPHVPANIESDAELDALDRFVTPAMRRGFGNMLYEMATAFVFASQLNATCLIAWWEQFDPQLDVIISAPFDGRPGPAPGITLKHIFPNIHYVSFVPSALHRANASNTYGLPKSKKAQYTPLPERFHQKRHIWTHGLSFKARCLLTLT
jgi:hypothetical protein